MHFANATAPALPASLAPLAATFFGLTDFHPQPRSKAALNPQMNVSGRHEIVPDDFASDL